MLLGRSDALGPFLKNDRLIRIAKTFMVCREWRMNSYFRNNNTLNSDGKIKNCLQFLMIVHF